MKKSEEVRNLFEKADSVEKGFERVQANLPGSEDVLEEARKWLAECVRLGRFLPGDSGERQALQRRVTYWTSILLHSGHPTSPELQRLADFDPNAGVVLDEECPYYGLAAATEAHSGSFFGRDEQIELYVRDLKKHSLLLQSESGGGKSSVAMAGVVPRLKAEEKKWLFLKHITPGAAPLNALSKAMVSGQNARALPGLANLDAAALKLELGGDVLFIFIDQLEELLTLCSVEDQRRFCDFLTDCIDFGKVRVFATLRMDHAERFANSDESRKLFVALTKEGGARNLPPMSFEDVRQVILRPAQNVGLRFIPPSLVDKLANEAANAVGALPLLQFALQRLWELRPKNEQGQPLDIIDEKVFAQLESVPKALGNRAESLFNALPGARAQLVCQRLILELTVLDERLEVPLRRRRRQDELIEVLAKVQPETGAADARDVIETFVRQRLLVRTGSAASAQIEVAHEALFRHWARFQDWINGEETRVRLRQVRQIARDAVEWDQARAAERPAGDYLKLQGEVLRNAARYDRDGWLDEVSHRYVQAAEEAARERARLAGERERLTQKLNEASWVVGGVGALLTIAVLVGILLVRNEEMKKGSALIGAVSLSERLPPLQALDLTYTLEKLSPGDFLSPLAHAIDRMGDSEVIGENRETGADFTASGHAISQIIRDPKSREVDVRIFPLGSKGQWAKPVRLKVSENPAILDVGPAIEGSKEGRMIVMSFLNQASGAATTFSKLVVYRVEDGNLEASPVEHPYPSDTNHVSEVAFDSTGRRAAIVAAQLSAEEPTSRLLLLTADSGKPVSVEEQAENEAQVLSAQRAQNEQVVTAVAFRRDSPRGAPALLTGRLNGAIYCGGAPVERQPSEPVPDQSPVMSLRTAGSAFVARHLSHVLEIGACGGEKNPVRALQMRPSAIQSLALSASSDAARVHLSFVDDRKLRCHSWPAGDLAPDSARHECQFMQGLEMDQAIPIPGGDGIDHYAALPDRRESWIVHLRQTSPRAEVSEGLPMARAPSEGRKEQPSHLASSPNGEHVVRLLAGDKWTAERRAADNSWKRFDLQTAAVGITVNDAGLIAVLRRNQQPGKAVSHLTLIDPRDKRSDFDFNAVGTCLKMSPDGQSVLAAGSYGEAMVVRVAGEPIVVQRTPSRERDKIQTGSTGVSSCALANNGTGVLGFEDGRVARVNFADGTLMHVSELVQFRVASSVIDVSIDAQGRFIALLGDRVQGTCADGMSGYPLRIWDMRQERSDFPTVKTCLATTDIVAIGPVHQSDKTLAILAVYQVRGSHISWFPFDCLACELPDSANAEKRVLEKAEKFSPRKLDPERVKALYGMEL